MQLLRSRTVRLLSFIAITSALIGFGGHAPVQAAGEGNDYATQALGAPWDMSTFNTIATQQTRINGSVSGLTFANGLLEATATNSDPRITLLLPTNPNANAALPEGGVAPIDTNVYRYLTARVNITVAGQAQVFWQKDMTTPYNGSAFKDVKVGWNEITFDLKAGGFGSNGSWSGMVQGLYFDPINKAGSFQIDYVRLSSTPLANPGNGVPQLRITAPSYASGPDYANTVLGNPWDMNDASDIVSSAALAPLSFKDGILSGTTGNCAGVGCGDPALTLRTSGVIDTKRFKYVTYRVQAEQQDATKDIGSVTRFFWWPTRPNDASTTRDTFAYEGWRTISLDLTKVKLEPSSQAKWTDSTPQTFRFDPHEYETLRTFKLDYITLTGDTQADTSFDIRYDASDTDGNTPATQFFFDTDAQGFDGTPISCMAARVQATAGNKVYIPLLTRAGGDLGLVTGASCHWQTANIPAGTYYVYGVTSDGIDTTRVYSQTPLIIAH